MVNDNWSVPDGADPARHAREQMVRDWRRQRRAIGKQERAISMIEETRCYGIGAYAGLLGWTRDVLDFLRELFAATEFALAVDLRDRGPLVMDGREYSHWHEDSTGLERVGVRNVEPAEGDPVAILNCPEDVP